MKKIQKAAKTINQAERPPSGAVTPSVASTLTSSTFFFSEYLLLAALSSSLVEDILEDPENSLQFLSLVDNVSVPGRFKELYTSISALAQKLV